MNFFFTLYSSFKASTQCTSAWIVAGVAAAAVLVLLFMVVVESAFIWRLRRYGLQLVYLVRLFVAQTHQVCAGKPQDEAAVTV